VSSRQLAQSIEKRELRYKYLCTSVGHDRAPCITADPISLLFVVWTELGSRKYVLDDGSDALPPSPAALPLDPAGACFAPRPPLFVYFVGELNNVYFTRQIF